MKKIKFETTCAKGCKKRICNCVHQRMQKIGFATMVRQLMQKKKRICNYVRQWMQKIGFATTVRQWMQKK